MRLLKFIGPVVLALSFGLFWYRTNASQIDCWVFAIWCYAVGYTDRILSELIYDATTPI